MKRLSLTILLLLPLATLAHANTTKFDAAMQPVAMEYLKIQEALAADSTKGIAEAAKAISTLAAKLDPKTVTGAHAKHYADLPAKVSAAASTLAAAKDISAAREALKLLSQPLSMWATMSTPAGVDVVYCSMAKGSWLQKAGAVRNPYYGAKMLACGEVVGGVNAVKK